MEINYKVYIGRGKQALIRFDNLQKLADIYFGGSKSKLFNGAVNKMFGLDPITGSPLGSLPAKPKKSKQIKWSNQLA